MKVDVPLYKKQQSKKILIGRAVVLFKLGIVWSVRSVHAWRCDVTAEQHSLFVCKLGAIKKLSITSLSIL